MKLIVRQWEHYLCHKNEKTQYSIDHISLQTSEEYLSFVPNSNASEEKDASKSEGEFSTLEKDINTSGNFTKVVVDLNTTVINQNITFLKSLNTQWQLNTSATMVFALLKSGGMGIELQELDNKKSIEALWCRKLFRPTDFRQLALSAQLSSKIIIAVVSNLQVKQHEKYKKQNQITFGLRTASAGLFGSFFCSIPAGIISAAIVGGITKYLQSAPEDDKSDDQTILTPPKPSCSVM